MSDAIKHECGIALVRLLKPLSYYKEKYGSAFYGINKMYLLMEKQHNRGQDGAGLASIKLDMKPGERYMSRIRSNQSQPIIDIFSQINERIQGELDLNPNLQDNIELLKKNLPYIGEVYLGHVRYGTFGKNSIESVHPFIRQNNWMHRNLIVAGNFNMTNVNELFNNLVDLGQHPKEKTDTITVMEKIGHFLDDEVSKLYKKLKEKGFSKVQASPEIVKKLNVAKILRKASKNWDGGYAMVGMLGHGDAFVLRDPSGIRPAFYFHNDEIAVVTSERPAIQTVFNVSLEDVHELPPGKAFIVKKSGEIQIKNILNAQARKACSFERIYFSRGNDASIYTERKALGKYLFPVVYEAIGQDLQNTVFSYIPNTAETSYLGMVEAANDYLNEQKKQLILNQKEKLDDTQLSKILSTKIRSEKIAIKDVKLRTFITEDKSRDDLVAHVYDVTYGVVKPTDNLVMIDDSIVRGTTLKKSILKILDRLKPKNIILVSSAPQIRFPDCYGIDMARLEDLIAFKATLELYIENKRFEEVESIYKNCKKSLETPDGINHVKAFYEPFTAQQISDKIAAMIKTPEIGATVKIIFQTVEDLHRSCPDHLGDWYFTGDYPTPGGNRVANRAFVNFYEGNKERAY
ncbi:MAG: amidophosphoribosyltransferase [Flavobacteriaceae bacterium]|nr:amidophosphoribosyltransferase [Flavobacteriaceae bacterium]